MDSSFRSQSERGSAILLFLLVVGLLIAGISYSLYLAKIIEQRMQLQDTADAAGFAVAAHTAQGLNMISANNLTIGASLHVATAVPMVANYASLIYAATMTIKDAPNELLSLGTEAMGKVVPPLRSMQFISQFQLRVWNRLAIVPSGYMSIAAGTTAFNRLIGEYWMIPAPLAGLEVARFNRPGSVYMVVPDKPKNSTSNKLVPSFEYLGLEQSTINKTLCHTLASSRRIGDKAAADNFANWLLAPLYTTNSKHLQDVTVKLNNLIDKAQNFAPLYLTFTDCGYGLKGGLIGLLQGASELASSSTINNEVELIKAANDVRLFYLEDKVSGDDAFQTKRKKHKTAIGSYNTYGCWGTDWHFSFDVTNKSAVLPFSGKHRKSDLMKRHIFRKTMDAIKDEVKQAPQQPTMSNYFCSMAGDLTVRDERGVLYRTMASCTDHAIARYKKDYDSWEKNRSPYTCTAFDSQIGAEVEHFDSLSFVDENQERKCLNIRRFDSRCAYIGLLNINSSTSCMGRIVKHIKDYQRGDECQGFGFYGTGDDVEELISYDKQIKSYMKGQSGSQKKMEQEIAFTYVRDMDSLVPSISFTSILTDPIRSKADLDKEKCPKAFVSKHDGREYCALDVIPSLLDDITKGKSVEADTSGLRHQLELLSGQAEEQQENSMSKLMRAWKKVQWTMSHHRVVKKRRVHPQGSLFWPDWHPIMETNMSEQSSPVIKNLLDNNSDKTIADQWSHFL